MTLFVLAAVAAVASVVGLFIGAVGVGGVLLIPALHALTPLSLQASMGTALFTFVFTGLVGTAMFQRRGSIDWRITIPLCAGGLVFGAVGAWANSFLDAKPLALVLAGLCVLVGIYTLFGGQRCEHAAFEGRPRAQFVLLVFVGAITGFGSGLTGVGGPAVSVPIMVLLGFPTLATIGASQVIQVLAALSGSAGYLWRDLVDLRLAAGTVLFEIAGVWLGVRLAHRVNARHLRGCVGVLCIAVGSTLLLRTL